MEEWPSTARSDTSVNAGRLGRTYRPNIDSERRRPKSEASTIRQLVCTAGHTRNRTERRRHSTPSVDTKGLRGYRLKGTLRQHDWIKTNAHSRQTERGLHRFMRSKRSPRAPSEFAVNPVTTPPASRENFTTPKISPAKASAK